MPEQAYTGSLALRLVGAEELLCRSAAFRNHVGAADAVEAKGQVYAGELTDVLELAAHNTLGVKRPCAIIGCESHRYVQISQGAQIDLGAEGGVWVLFFDNPAHSDNYKLSLYEFANWISAVMDDVARAVGKDASDEIENAT